MKVDKAFEKKMDEKFKAWWEPFIETNVTLREVIKDELSISCIRWLFHIGFSLGSDAGAEYGSKKARIKTLEEIYKKIEEINTHNIVTKKINTVYVGAKLAEYIDTEIKKAKDE